MTKKNNGNFSFYAIPCNKPFVIPSGFLTGERKRQVGLNHKKFLEKMNQISEEKEHTLKKTINQNKR